ncbi:MAG: FAD/NAD(P)-binding protein [Chloroflexaceae bacterium]|jgi:thioredoxin reductase|nr:FAD/NAD(P)-binding protein [Chloroflexaceae bacterium]
MLDWLIVGGGLHGVHLAHVLVRRGGVPLERLALLDPHTRLLARWQEMTANTGMAFLRSSRVHHLGLAPTGLIHFARSHAPQQGQFYGPYGRPALSLFQAHCEAIVAETQLDQRHLVGQATGLERLAHGWRVETDQGELTARQLLLAISVCEQPRWPTWAVALQAAGAPIQHLYQGGFRREALPPWQHLVVVGGGISAAQAALACARQAPGTVTLLLRHPIRDASFDSAPCWLGPACLARFWQEPHMVRRREMIAAARNPGSMPSDVARSLRRAVRCGMLRLCEAEVSNGSYQGSGPCTLQLRDGATVQADQVLLATGFEQSRPGGAWLDAAIAAYELPCAPCGYPVVQASLQWASGLFVTGALAELELGPPARNIAGARHAAERLCGSR